MFTRDNAMIPAMTIEPAEMIVTLIIRVRLQCAGAGWSQAG